MANMEHWQFGQFMIDHLMMNGFDQQDAKDAMYGLREYDRTIKYLWYKDIRLFKPHTRTLMWLNVRDCTFQWLVMHQPQHPMIAELRRQING